MATVQLADVYTPLTFERVAQQQQTEFNAFLASGIMVNDPLITQRLSGGAKSIDLPQYKGLGIKEPNYASDDPAVKSVANKLDSVLQKATSATRNDSWAQMDLAADLNLGQEALAAIAGRVGQFWATDDEHRLSSSLSGVKADNVANDAGDMVYSIALDTVDPVTAAEKISAEAIADAMQTMGDHKTKLVAMAMHSQVQTQLSKLKLVEPRYDSATNVFLFNTYNGLRIIVDDSLAPEVGTNRLTYTSILFAAGSVGYGTGPVSNASAMDRDEKSGNGSGETFLHSRVNTCLHPYGFQFTGNNVAAEFANYVELESATNWTRVTERKLVGIAFLETNG